MKYSKLGNTDVNVSKICLGTMTFGEQNSEKEAHEQLQYAVEQGINFIDTAEMYSVPAKPETYGLTEKYIGSWLKKQRRREDLVIATKIAGPHPEQTHIRGGSKYTMDHIREAVESSLKRLKTDYIDLYQLHWPERKTNFFKSRGYKHDPEDTWENNFIDVLLALKTMIEEGKIRMIGLSNETPWGLMSFLKLSEIHDLPRLVSIQNPYSLINRTFETGLAEIAIREQCGLLAYSPLGAGMLSGKYHQTSPPENARLSLFPFMKRFSGEYSKEATQKYIEIAQKHQLTPVQLALAFVNSRPFLTSNIIGATSMQQLKENIHSIDISLKQEVLDEIEEVQEAHPNPAP